MKLDANCDTQSLFSDMPCMIRGSQKTEGVGPLIDGLERRAAVVPVIPANASHKGSQGQESVGPLVSSQGRRALAVLYINQSSTGGETLVVFLDPVYIGFPLFVPPRVRAGRLSSVPRRARWTVFVPLGASTRHHPIPSRRAPWQPTRLAAVRRPVPGHQWGVRVLGSTNKK